MHGVARLPWFVHVNGVLGTVYRYIKGHGSIEMPVSGDAFKRRDGLSEEAIKARIGAIVRYLQSIQQRLG